MAEAPPLKMREGDRVVVMNPGPGMSGVLLADCLPGHRSVAVLWDDGTSGHPLVKLLRSANPEDRLFATALDASVVAALKAEVRESARNALLNDLHDKLSEMELHDRTGDAFDNGYRAAWLEVRTWMVSQGLDLNAENGTT